MAPCGVSRLATTLRRPPALMALNMFRVRISLLALLCPTAAFAQLTGNFRLQAASLQVSQGYEHDYEYAFSRCATLASVR